ncbi:hypothetical protein QCO44_09045 [Selenomonas sputigena]|uniref:Uncharacterized protein n=1 Tax=Selenomonas sputigena TaxID=69823 RepID=A0ABV3X6G5_9FIRM
MHQDAGAEFINASSDAGKFLRVSRIYGRKKRLLRIDGVQAGMIFLFILSFCTG